MTEEKIEQKKGTTTVGIVCKGAIVLAADKRASMGWLIANKEIEKIFQISLLRLSGPADWIAYTLGDCGQA